MSNALPPAHKMWDNNDYQMMAEKPNNGINRPVYYLEYIRKHGNIVPKETEDDICEEDKQSGLPESEG